MPLEALHGKRPAAGHGHRTVVQQIAVLNMIHTALGVEELHMLLHFFALAEGLHQLGQHQLLVRVQCCRGGRIYGGERSIPQGIFRFPDHHRVLFPIDAAQVVPSFHLEIRVAVDDLTLQLEHHNADGLVHHSTAVQHPLRIGAACGIGMGHPDGQIIVPVELLCHALQMAQVDAVAVLQHPVVMVSQCRLEHCTDTDGAACCGSHPHHIVVAPLDIHIVVAHEQVQDDVRARAAVEQITHDMQLVHSQMLDQFAQPDDKAIRAAIFYDAAHDLAIIQVFVVILEMGVQQLVQNIAAAGRQALAHMVTGMLGGNQTADVDKPQQRIRIPLLQCFFAAAACLELWQLLVGVIDQRRQFGTAMLRHGVAQHLIHLFADDTGGGVQDMHKGFVFAVQIAHEMLGAFGQLEQCLRADDLAGRCRLRGVVPGKQGQILQVLTDLIGFGAHDFLHHGHFSAAARRSGRIMQRCCF